MKRQSKKLQIQGAQILRNEAYLQYTAMTKDAAQHRSWTFYEAVNFVWCKRVINLYRKVFLFHFKLCFFYFTSCVTFLKYIKSFRAALNGFFSFTSGLNQPFNQEHQAHDDQSPKCYHHNHTDPSHPPSARHPRKQGAGSVLSGLYKSVIPGK